MRLSHHKLLSITIIPLLCLAASGQEKAADFCLDNPYSCKAYMTASGKFSDAFTQALKETASKINDYEDGMIGRVDMRRSLQRFVSTEASAFRRYTRQRVPRPFSWADGKTRQIHGLLNAGAKSCISYTLTARQSDAVRCRSQLQQATTIMTELTQWLEELNRNIEEFNQMVEQMLKKNGSITKRFVTRRTSYIA